MKYIYKEKVINKINFQREIKEESSLYFDSKNNLYVCIEPPQTVMSFNKEGLLHNINRPAIIVANKEYFYKNGFRHREDGPAGLFFWLNDFKYLENEFAEKTNHLVCKVCNVFCKQKCFN